MATTTEERDQTSINRQQGDEVEVDEETPLIYKSKENTQKITRLQVGLCLIILITELCERLAYYSMSSNLVLYCKDVLHLQTPVPSQIVLGFTGFSAFLPIFGGWLADTYLGRFNTIYGSGLIYFVGSFILAVSTYDYREHGLTMSLSFQIALFAISLILIAFGTGGIKANVSPFGADQIRSTGERALELFFNCFYWFINIGSLIAVTVVADIQQEIAFFYGYLITALSMLLALLIFLTGRNYYIIDPPHGSALSKTVEIVWEGLKIKWSRSKANNNGTWLDQTKISNGGSFPDLEVKDVKNILPLFPIFLTYIIYWVGYSQMLTSFLRQGTQMRLKTKYFNVPVASLSVFDSLIIVVLIPILAKGAYPLLRRWGIKVTPLRKIGVGMIIAAISLVVAGAVEIERKEFIKEYGIFYQAPFDTPTNASSMSILYQIPQYIFVGASEVLVVITGLEFAYSQSSKSLRGVVMGLFIAMSGCGLFLATALTTIISSLAPDWYPDNLNTGSLEKFYFLVAGIMLLNYVIFLALALRYKYTFAESDSSEEEATNSEKPKDEESKLV